MRNTIVDVETKDELPLYGLLSESGKNTIVINIHGTGSNFYENDFVGPLAEALDRDSISFLSTNNRGASVLQAYPPCGSAMEYFEDCLLDIDAWVEFVISRGYSKIILQGHSLGTEKLVYYMSHGKYKDKISSIILLGFSDSYGHQEQYDPESKLMIEAKKLIKENKGHQFLTSDWLSHSGVMPKNADSFVNFFSKGSELSYALPLRKGDKLELFSKISVPILAVIGDQKEYTMIPIKKAIELLNKENSLTESHQIKDCDHCFEGKEAQLSEIILEFLKAKI